NIWTKIHNNHTFKWGADIRRLRDDLVQGQTFSPRGLFRFGSGTTSIAGAKTSIANNFAAFLLDTPTEVGRDIAPISGSWRETELFFFGQDTWHATNKLTVDAGLRPCAADAARWPGQHGDRDSGRPEHRCFARRAGYASPGRDVHDSGQALPAAVRGIVESCRSACAAEELCPGGGLRGQSRR